MIQKTPKLRLNDLLDEIVESNFSEKRVIENTLETGAIMHTDLQAVHRRFIVVNVKFIVI